MKRILIIAVIVLAAAGIVAAGIFLRGGTNGGAEPPVDGLPSGGLPTADTGAGSGGGAQGGAGTGGLPAAGLSILSQAAVLDYAVSPQMGLLMVDAGGAVIQATSSEAIIARADFGDILGAWFSPDGKWLVVKSGEATAARWSLLDVAKKTWRDLTANTSEMFWSPNGSQLAYFARRTDGSALTTFTPATGATRTLLALSAPELTLRWGAAGHILIMDKPSALVAGTVWDFSLTANTLTPFAVNVAGAQVIWGGAQSGGLLFSAGPTGGDLALVDERGASGQTATFLTLPSKCAFGDTPTAATNTSALANYLFCAIPQDARLLSARQLPDSYLKKEFATADALYAVDLANRVILPVLPAATAFSFDAANMKIYGTDLYFTDRNTRKLYRASLQTIIATGTAQ